MARTTGNLGYSNALGGITTVATPNVLDISSLTGSTLNTWKSFTFIVGAGTILINGVTFGVGTYTWDNSPGTLNPLSYDASLSTDAKIIFTF